MIPPPITGPRQVDFPVNEPRPPYCPEIADKEGLIGVESTIRLVGDLHTFTHKIFDRLNSNYRLTFDVNKETGAIAVSLVDVQSNNTIRTIEFQSVQQVLSRFDQREGLFVDTQA